MEKQIKIGFIGTGHMGASLALAIKDFPNSFLLFLHEKIKNSKVLSLKEVIEQSEYLFIGVNQLI